MKTARFVETVGGKFISSTRNVRSLHPFYSVEDVSVDPTLLGVWGSSSQDSTLTFSDSGAKLYKMVGASGADLRSEGFARLFVLDEVTFIDVNKAPLSMSQRAFFLPLHFVLTIVMVPQPRPILRLSALNVVWVEEFLAKNPTAIKHEFHSAGVVFLDTTERVKAFLRAHLKVEGFFDPFVEMEYKGPAS